MCALRVGVVPAKDPEPEPAAPPPTRLPERTLAVVQ
jgi:hypothetical protein